jgi:protein TonB
MSSEEQVKAEPSMGTFVGCLVDGDATENAGKKKTKRRAMGISVVLQTAGLAVLVIAPLFAKPAELTERVVLPIPLYRHQAPARNASPVPQTTPKGFCLVCAINSKPSKGPVVTTQNISEAPGEGVVFIGEGADTSQIEMLDTRPRPKRPDDPPPATKRIHEPVINPALLTRRIEPVYPLLARQLRRSGRVELHAVIAVDGSIQELQAVSGDPLLISSALEAVRQWHYQPTYLNGQPVEIDTYITVIYTLQQ